MGGDFPLAYMITWTTYGSWLPGDARGWVERGTWDVQPPDSEREEAARRAMTDVAVILTREQRDLVEATIVKQCEIRGWVLHARNARTNHVHVVVSAALDGKEVRAQLKAWCSQALSKHAGLAGRSRNGLRRWWTEKGDVEWIDDEEHLYNAIRYVTELQ
jgi:hypothetical protein